MSFYFSSAFLVDASQNDLFYFGSKLLAYDDEFQNKNYKSERIKIYVRPGVFYGMQWCVMQDINQFTIVTGREPGESSTPRYTSY